MARDNEFEILDHFLRILVEKHKRLEENYYRKYGLVGLSTADIRAVRRIGLSDRERMSHLAKGLKLAMGTLTATVDHLVSKGYVLRWRPDHDRRVVEVSLSEKGNKAFHQIEESRIKVAEKIFGQLDAGEREVLKGILNKLVTRE